jgi:hypothetical protein
MTKEIKKKEEHKKRGKQDRELFRSIEPFEKKSGL